MDSFSYEDDDSQIFEPSEQISPENDSAQWKCVRNLDEYDMWTSSPQSVAERRTNFIRRLGLSPEDFEGHSFGNKTCCNNITDGNVEGDCKRNVDYSEETVLKTSCLEEKCSSDTSSASNWSAEDVELSTEVEGAVNFRAQQFFLEGDEGFNGGSPREMGSKWKHKWLSKLSNIACISAMEIEDVDSGNLGQVRASGMKRVKVNRSRKRSKELSGLFVGRTIRAHEGSISVMKFSPDGRYLASAGEDKLVKVWQVVEEERSDSGDFSVNHLSEFGPHMTEKDRFNNKFKIMRKNPDSACVVLPPKVFRILEEPVNVFRGHGGEISDLSWSKNNHLLSSSIDKTVRLWRVGVDRCLKVFSHTDYVTCIQFNPVDDDYFVSGSIDGKVRIWEIGGSHVVKWTETRDIITAVSLRPDGKGGVIGFITGNCRFFNMSDGQIQLESQFCLTSKKKKKPHCKRVTGFQFLPRDPSKVLVTCADSQVRVINGTEVLAKYKGSRNVGRYTSASFTLDEKHIISPSDDSNIYLWSYTDDPANPSLSQPKSVRSFECFSSSETNVATTWPGFNTGNTAQNVPKPRENDTVSSFPFSSRGSSSATWPEEKLPAPSPRETGGSHHRLLSGSYGGSFDSHAWGLVVVTGDWRGLIRPFNNYGLPKATVE